MWLVVSCMEGINWAWQGMTKEKGTNTFSPSFCSNMKQKRCRKTLVVLMWLFVKLALFISVFLFTHFSKMHIFCHNI